MNKETLTPEQLFSYYIEKEVDEDIWRYLEETNNNPDYRWEAWDWL